MADLSGTVLVNGHPPIHSFDVYAYSCPPEMSEEFGGLRVYVEAEDAVVSTVDGSPGSGKHFKMPAPTKATLL